MTIPAICKALGDGLPPLFGCEPHGEYVRVQTPYLYPDGDEWCRRMAIARSSREDDLPSVVLRVAQAAPRISDLWFTFRTRSIESVTDEIADSLDDRGFQMDRGEKAIGRSGKVWKPDFHVRSPSRSSLVYVLSTGSRSAARQVVKHVYTAFADQSHLHLGPEALQLVSLFDDDSDDRGNQFRLTLYWHNLATDEELHRVAALDTLNEDEKRAVMFAARTGRIRNADVRDLTGRNTVRASELLRRLVDLGQLRKQGGGSGTFYTPSGSDLDPTSTQSLLHFEDDEADGS